jgi:hypothetical protein
MSRQGSVVPLDMYSRRIPYLKPPPVTLLAPKIYEFNLAHLLQDNGGTYANVKLGTRRSRAQLRKRELGAVIPYHHSINEPVPPGAWQVALIAAMCIYQYQGSKQTSGTCTTVTPNQQLHSTSVSPRDLTTSCSKNGREFHVGIATDMRRKRIEPGDRSSDEQSYPAKTQRFSGQLASTKPKTDREAGRSSSQAKHLVKGRRKIRDETPIEQTHALVNQYQLPRAPAPQVASSSHRKRKADPDEYYKSHRNLQGQADIIQDSRYSKTPRTVVRAQVEAEVSQSRRKQEVNEKERSLLERFGLLAQRDEKQSGMGTAAIGQQTTAHKCPTVKKKTHQLSQIDCNLPEHALGSERKHVIQSSFLPAFTNHGDMDFEINQATVKENDAKKHAPPTLSAQNGLISHGEGINPKEDTISISHGGDSPQRNTIGDQGTSDNERAKHKHLPPTRSRSRQKTLGRHVQQLIGCVNEKKDRMACVGSLNLRAESTEGVHTPMRPRNLSCHYPPLSSSQDGFHNSPDRLMGGNTAPMSPENEYSDDSGEMHLSHRDPTKSGVGSQGGAGFENRYLTLTSMQKEIPRLVGDTSGDAARGHKRTHGCLGDKEDKVEPLITVLSSRCQAGMQGSGDKKDQSRDAEDRKNRRRRRKEEKRQRKRDRKDLKRKKKEKGRVRDANHASPSINNDDEPPHEKTVDPKSNSKRSTPVDLLQRNAIKRSSQDFLFVEKSQRPNVLRVLQPSGSPRECALDSTATPWHPGIDLPGTLETFVSGNGDNLSAIQLLCSEAFLETWSAPISELASGGWAASMAPTSNRSKDLVPSFFLPGLQSTARKIQFLDTSLIDRCGVDIEVDAQDGIIVAALSDWQESSDAKSFLRRIVGLASQGRYKHIHVILCADVEIEDATCDHIINLQSALMMHRGNPPTLVSFRLVSPASLSLSLAQIVLASPSSRADFEEFISNDQIHERIIFLLQLVPTLSVGRALQWFRSISVADTAPEEDHVRQWFQGLLGKGDHVRKQIITTNRSEQSGGQESPMVQLSYAVGVFLGSK